ncbi:hypothetical protein [Celerinatantimonas yamalensis]|uniref:Uncharacterized protein n=1 Tax=Celerinatantimonas yamalensis TaxID=559956 RepID=A0ABW9G4E5_9GAMM
MKRFFAGVMVLLLCCCALMQLASPMPLLWFVCTLFVALVCMLCAWGVWYRKLAFIALLGAALGLGWLWQGTLWLLSDFNQWDSVTFFSSNSPFLQMRHALILWMMAFALIGILVDRQANSPTKGSAERIRSQSTDKSPRTEPKL